MDFPKISVIVPIYNVQQYLEECLDSLAKQTFKDIEIIMVNDGSTDSSGKIMHRYAEEHDRFFAYDKPNGGLGQARNFGVQFARGEYLAFVDSDDIVDALAYEKMYKSVSQTNSDMVIGNVMRFNSTKQYSSVLHQKVFSKRKLKAHITRDYELIYDTTAWNKLYRRSFWQEHHLQFPEGMLYEDIPVTFPAHYLANSVDVLDDVVYYWRARDFGDKSITQNRTDIHNLTDRLKAVKMVNQFFESHQITGELKETKDFKILDVDLLVYLNELTEADDHYIDTYIDEVSHYLEGVSESSISKLWPIDRMKYHFVKRHDKQKVLELLELQKSGELRRSKVIQKDGQYYIDYPFKELVPESYLRIDENLQVRKKVVKAEWTNQTLTVKGYCFIDKINVRHKSDVDLHFALENAETGELLPIQHMVLSKRPNNTYRFGIDAKQRFQPFKRVFNYNWSEFHLSIDFNDAPFSSLPEGEYFIQGTLTAGGLKRTFRVGAPIKGNAPRPQYTSKNETILYGKYNGAWELTIYKEPMSNRLENVEIENQFIRLTGVTNLSLEKSQLLLTNQMAGIKQTYSFNENHEPSRFVCEIPVAALKNKENVACSWEIFILQGDEEYPVFIPKDQDGRFQTLDTGYAELWVKASSNGYPLLEIQEYGAHLLDLRFTDTHVVLDIDHPSHWKERNSNKEAIRLLLLSKNHSEVHYFPLEYLADKNYFQADINLEKDLNEDTFIYDDFDLKLIRGDWNGVLASTVPIYADQVNQEKDAMTIDHKQYRFNLGTTLSLKINPVWGWIERGELRREALQRIFYRIARLLPMKKNMVVFESYWGKNYECNPRALYEYIDKNYPEYETVWNLRNPLTHIEGNAKKVRMQSLKYFYYMARAKYFVNNVNFADFYRKRKGAVELQTMHGTPLKTLGLDAPGEINSPEWYVKKNRRWDYLSVPSDYVANIGVHAYDHTAKVLNTGYPRNDKLFTENTPEKIAEIKRKLGIPIDKKIIFYAPTWRIKNKFKLELDISRLKENVSDDYVLLVKFHHFVADAVELDEDDG